jgi:hypothetical protein
MPRSLYAIAIALALGQSPTARAQVALDTSTSNAVIESLAELHESWTLSQFSEFLRAMLIAQLPEAVADPASWQEARDRWEFLEDGLVGWAVLSTYLPLLLENDPFVLDRQEAGPWLQQSFRRVLRDQTVVEVVRAGREREYAVMLRLQERYEDWSRELETQIENAARAASRADVSAHHARHVEELHRRLDDMSMTIQRLGVRASWLEGFDAFLPGAVACDLELGIDLSTEQAMMADLEALADSCPQQRLIGFLRAAAALSAVPEHLADQGARLDRSALQRIEEDLSSASRTIGGLTAFLQRDPLMRGLDTVPERLKVILAAALQGRSIAVVVPEGERLERAFLLALRQDVSARLRSEMAERRAQRPTQLSHEAQRLRAYIRRITGRLAMLET